MRVVSRIFLIFSGILFLFSVLSTLLYLAFLWFVSFINIGFNIALIVLNETGANPELFSLLLQISSYTDIFKYFMMAMGLMGVSAETTDSMLSIYLGIEAVIELVSTIIATVVVVIPLIFSFVCMIICFTAARKKAKKGSHVAVIVFAVLNYFLGSGWLLIILMLLGGIFGVIADNKDRKKLEEARRRHRYKALPYYAH